MTMWSSYRNQSFLISISTDQDLLLSTIDSILSAFAQSCIDDIELVENRSESGEGENAVEIKLQSLLSFMFVWF